MTKFEYKTLNLRLANGMGKELISAEELDKILNELGTEGWELIVHIQRRDFQKYLVLKRPLED